jgi:hypothetical protein
LFALEILSVKMVAVERRGRMLTFGPEVTRTVAAEHAERLRESAGPGRRALRRRLGGLLVAAGRRLDPHEPVQRGASPCEGSHLVLGR